jgi:RHS repeat-associated protein
MERDKRTARYFYQGNKLVGVKKAAQDCTIFRVVNQPLAERRSSGSLVGLLAVDRAGSVIQHMQRSDGEHCAYSVYGDAPLPRTHLALGFNGEQLEQSTDRYWLGQGYRKYDSRLMRFLSPDRISPFGAGGLNAYGYCTGDPVNYSDPSGRMRDWVAFLLYRKKLASIRSHLKMVRRRLDVENETYDKRLKRFDKESTTENHKRLTKTEDKRDKAQGELDYYQEQEKHYRYKKAKARYAGHTEEALHKKLLDKRGWNIGAAELQRIATAVRSY